MDDSLRDFKNSNWANIEFAADYLQDSDIFIPQRKQVLQLIKQIFSFYIGTRVEKPNVIDLGCGDGVITKTLTEVNNNLLSILVDGSEHMLESAKKNLADRNIKAAILISFQDLYNSSVIKEEADFIVSSLAIHHLNDVEKICLYKYIYTILKNGGVFINYDPVISPSRELEQLNLTIWKEWIVNLEAKIQPKKDKSLDFIPKQYKSNKDNLPGTIDTQLHMLKQAGFSDVDLYYKYGSFCLFGGRK